MPRRWIIVDMVGSFPRIFEAVPVPPELVYDRCGDEKGSNPEEADDLCLVRILALRPGCETRGWDLSHQAGIGDIRLGLGPPS